MKNKNLFKRRETTRHGVDYDNSNGDWLWWMGNADDDFVTLVTDMTLNKEILKMCNQSETQHEIPRYTLTI